MGQGLHTKMCQIAARALGISLSSVRVAETATDKVPNASPTAASASSDIYGMAVLDACEQIARRLEPVRKRLGPSASFKQVVQTAYFERINLSAQGFYKTPNVGYDFDLTSARTNAERGTPFRYFTCGVACSEVEIDALTGDLQVLEADVLMDLGQSLNPAIDIGQIEGGWTQGFGLFTMEEMTWGDSDHPWIKPRGRMFTIGPSTYKIPSFADAPVKFNVRLLHNSPNPRAVHSSKAVGEPPLFLAFSVYCAARRAIAAARKDAGLDGHFVTHSPLTSERIRMACRDKFTRCGPLRSAVDAAYRPRGSW